MIGKKKLRKRWLGLLGVNLVAFYTKTELMLGASQEDCDSVPGPVAVFCMPSMGLLGGAFPQVLSEESHLRPFQPTSVPIDFEEGRLLKELDSSAAVKYIRQKNEPHVRHL